MLDCGKNPLLKKLEAAENALQDKLDSLKELGAGALADIKSEAEELEKTLKDSIPEIPEIPDFQKEIKDLIDGAKVPGSQAAKDLLKNLQALENQWKEIVPDIQKTLDLVKNPVKLLEGINICDEVPKVEAKKNEDGTLAATPTTVDQVENIEPNPEQKKEEPSLPPADELPKEEFNEETGEGDPPTQSEFSLSEAKKALREMCEAEDSYMKILKAKMDKETKGKRANDPSTKVRTLKNALPKAWKQKNSDGTVYDYYLLEDVPIPKAINQMTLRKCKVEAYNNMLDAIGNYRVRIFNTLRKRPDKNGKERWINGDFNPTFKKEMQQNVYYDLGFGVREYKPEYGFGFRKNLGLRESAEKVGSAFSFKIKDYKANFTPYFQSLSDMKDGKGAYTESDNTYENLLKEYVEAIFNATVKLKSGTYFCYQVMVSYTQNIALAELLDSPQAEDFIPTTLGGKLPLWEDVLLGTVTTEEFQTQQLYTEDTFVPHFMYRESNDGTTYVTQYANTYEEHLELANLGYQHGIPK